MPKCKVCRKEFTRSREGQVVCSYECSIEYGSRQMRKVKLAEAKDRRSALKRFKASDVSELKSTAQKVINRYARLRDELERGYQCVTCGHKFGQMDGGHFLPTSSYSAIRYNTNQIFQQCKSCNRFKGGAPLEYRLFMVDRHGEEYVKRLESTKNQPRKYTVEYYQKLIRVVRKKTKIVEKKLKN